MVFLQIKQKPNYRNYFKLKGTYIVPFLLVMILLSCRKSNDFGLSVQPSQDLLSANQTDSTSIITYSVIEDSLKTDELPGSNLLGSYVDPYFGSLKTSIYTQIRLESSYDFRPNGSTTIDGLVVDSVILYLALDNYYGNLGGQTFEVYQLNDDLFLDSTYYTNSSKDSIPLNLVASGVGEINPNPQLPGYVKGELVDEAILRIPLSINDFAIPIMQQSGTTTLDGNDGDNEFLDWFKGLIITTNNSSQNINQGAIYYTDLLSSYSKITLFYRDTSGLAADHDTLSFDFNLNANCARFHSSIIDNSSSIVGNTINDTTLGQDLFFVQSLGGCKGKIFFPYLDQIVDSSIIINKAELILPFQYYILDAYTPASTLILTSENSEGNAIFLPDFFESNHGGSIDLINKNYRFNITRYINDIVAGQTINAPLSLITSGSGITANRSILNGFNSSKKDKPKLILTYSNY
jgi:hypothetical protein